VRALCAVGAGRAFVLGFAAILAGVALVNVLANELPDEPAGEAPDVDSVMRVLGAPAQGFASARAPRVFRFPADHGPHPEFRTEWWYYTGNVAADDGRPFAFQLTFFRIALTPQAPARVSAWASNQVYMAHFAVSDIAEDRFHAAERFSREALGMAGAQPAPFRVWLGDWQAGAADGNPAQRLAAKDGGYAIDLRLGEAKAPVLNGDAGLSQKSAGAGNASYYYSVPRVAVAGRLSTPAGAWQVRGSAWFDREWSSSALAADQAGWDWFALQLSDGRDLMIYQLRARDGSVDAHSAGTLVEADGRARALAAADFTVEPLDYWRSPRDGARYPSRWRLRVPDAGIDLQVTPAIADQEINLAFRYWEGASRASGTSAAAPVTGHGHVELTGYAAGGASMTR
jgi:predicted secreted hydrolase